MNSPPTSLSSLLSQPTHHTASGNNSGTQPGPETSSLRDQGSVRSSSLSGSQAHAQADDDLSTGQAALLTYLRDHCAPGSAGYASAQDVGNAREDQALGSNGSRSQDAYAATASFDPQLSDPAMFTGADPGADVTNEHDAYVDPALAALAQRDLISADRHAATFPPLHYGHPLHDPDAVNAALQAKADKGEMGGKRKRPVMPIDSFSLTEQATLGSIPGSSLLNEEAAPEDDEEGGPSKKSKDGKDTKVKRAEQNRKAQQAFRKRREEHIKKLEYDSAALEEVTKARDEALERWQYVRMAWETARIEIAALQATLVNLSRHTALHITKPDGSLYLASGDQERMPTERTTDTDLEVAFQILQTQAKAIALRNQTLDLQRSAANQDVSVALPRVNDA